MRRAEWRLFWVGQSEHERRLDRESEALKGFANYGWKPYVEGLRNASGAGRLDARGWTEVGETDSTPLFCYGLLLS